MKNEMTSNHAGGDTAAPQVGGEKLVARLRLVCAFVGVVLTLLYRIHTEPPAWPSLYAMIVIFFIWGAFSGAYLVAIARNYFRLWMSYLSTTFDFLAITAVQIAYMATITLNFVNSPITACYFVVIGLAAMRKDRALVLYAGIGSALGHLALCAVAFALYFPEGYALVEINGHPLELTFLDEIVVAVAMVIVAVAMSHVTKELRESERHYHDLFEHVPDGILIVSEKGSVLAVNQRLASMADTPPERLIGRRLSELLVRNGENGNGHGKMLTDKDVSAVLVRPDSKEIPVRTVAMPLKYKGENCVEMSVRDVTEHVLLARQLAQSQKMETLGRLAGGLAHDFNNILGGILGAASLADRNVAKLDGHPVREKLARQIAVVRECGERASDVVKRLMSFSRSRALETMSVDLNRIITDVATIAGNTLGENIVLTTELLPGRAIVEGDVTSLTQALLNLCINARDAMPDGGRLTIRLESMDGAPNGHPEVDSNVDLWCIEVQDTGTGVDRRSLDKIFDPFFTTKPVGEGTGLGLPMVYNIAREHNGFVDVESHQGSGSIFRLFLPGTGRADAKSLT